MAFAPQNCSQVGDFKYENSNLLIIAELISELDLDHDTLARRIGGGGGSVGRVCKSLSAPASREVGHPKMSTCKRPPGD